VAGLDVGGACRGRAFRVARPNVEKVKAYLLKRELNANVYVPKYLRVRLDDGRRVEAYGFIAKRDSGLYLGKLAESDAARMVVQGNGRRGSGLEYLKNTVAHLDQLGIADGPLHRILEMAEALKK